jgi:hypothetical protein
VTTLAEPEVDLEPGDSQPMSGRKQKKEMTRCGFCAFPNKLWGGPGTPHPNCPRAVRNGPNAQFKIITCECKEPGCGDQVLRCTYCKSEEPGAIDPNDWSCIDKESCRAGIQTRLVNNPLYQELEEIRSTAMAKVANENAEKATKKAAAAPKTGECLHCGGTTKGGKFLPGHDAAYVSALVAESLKTPKTEDANRKKAVAASESLGRKFDKSIGLAKDKAAKKAKDAEAKAAEKAKATKEKATASA